jgi:hypothetical protein
MKSNWIRLFGAATTPPVNHLVPMARTPSQVADTIKTDRSDGRKIVGAPVRRRQVAYLHQRRPVAAASMRADIGNTSTLRYQSRLVERDAPAVAAVRDLATQCPRYCYRLIQLKCLTVIDEFTRECLAIDVLEVSAPIGYRAAIKISSASMVR